MSDNLGRVLLSTRLAFFVAGFCMASWAPLVPFVKARLAVEEGTLGMLLLCIGIGSIFSMPVSGAVSARTGSKPVIIAAGIGMIAALPLLGFVSSNWSLGLSLLLFGASLGALDVAMNVQAVEVEQAAARPIMSGFHAFFSLGGFAGSGGMTALLSLGVTPLHATVGVSALAAVAIGISAPRLLESRPTGDGPMFVMPRGIVLVLALMTSALFLVEGAMLDWGALLLTQTKLASAERAGVGYMIFSIAMTVCRFAGDRVVERIGGTRTLVFGGLTMVAGIVVLLVAPVAIVAMAGFLLIGIGASNLVPIIFSAAGRQTAMPPSFAIAAVTTLGYAGILLGPALIGFVADAWSLRAAFWILAGVVALVPIFAKHATANSPIATAPRER